MKSLRSDRGRVRAARGFDPAMQACGGILRSNQGHGPAHARLAPPRVARCCARRRVNTPAGSSRRPERLHDRFITGTDDRRKNGGRQTRSADPETPTQARVDRESRRILKMSRSPDPDTGVLAGTSQATPSKLDFIRRWLRELDSAGDQAPAPAQAEPASRRQTLDGCRAGMTEDALPPTEAHRAAQNLDFVAGCRNLINLPGPVGTGGSHWPSRSDGSPASEGVGALLHATGLLIASAPRPAPGEPARPGTREASAGRLIIDEFGFPAHGQKAAGSSSDHFRFYQDKEHIHLPPTSEFSRCEDACSAARTLLPPPSSSHITRTAHQIRGPLYRSRHALTY